MQTKKLNAIKTFATSHQVTTTGKSTNQNIPKIYSRLLWSKWNHANV